MPPPLDLANLSTPRFLLAFAVCFAVAAVPILVVGTLPLVDYPNHLARMHIIAASDGSAALRQFYAIVWRPVPNLAMDAVIPLLARIMPLEWAGKLFFLATFLLISGGTAWLHRALFGRWSAWSLLAFLLLYNRSLLWGFGNFLCGVGLALVATALWVALRERSTVVRLALATAMALAVYFAHFFAFGAYALLILGFETARLHRQGWLASARGLGELCLASLQFVPPVAIFLAAGSGSGGAGGIVYSRLVRKLDLMFNIVDNYVTWLDILTLVLLVGLFAVAAARNRLQLSRVMVLPLVALCLAQLAMPNRILGAAGVDHRMPLILALVLIAASDFALRDRRRQAAVAAALAALFLVRMAVITTTWLDQDSILAPMVAALERLPAGSRVAVAYPPETVNVSRRAPPLVHLAAYAAIGADAFVPTLFAEPGQQPLRLTPPYASLATAVSPDTFWTVLAEATLDAQGAVAAALRHYDFILFSGVGAQNPCDASPLAPRAAIPGARLCAVRPTD